MAASTPEPEQVPAEDSYSRDESDLKLESQEMSQPDAATAGTANSVAENAEAAADPPASADPPKDSFPGANQGAQLEKTHSDEDGNLTLGDLRAAVEEIDDNLDDAFGQAADSFWNFATSVTGKVSSVVKDQPSLETLRRNVTNRLTPFSNISRDIQTQIVTLAPNEKSIASFAGSVKSVADTVQRNAAAMEEAILATANNVGTSNAETSQLDVPAELTAGDPGVAVLPEMQGPNGLDEIAKVGESVTNALEQTVGGLWSGLWGTGEVEDWEPKKAKVPKTRFAKRIFELQANPDTYCEPAKDLDAFEEWGKDFNLNNYEEECMELLYTHDAIADLYERVVPRVVEEDTFWMRYFFAKHNLQIEEERRQKLLERAENAVEGADDDDDDGWGDDDWADESPDEDDGDTNPKRSPAQGSSRDANSAQETTAVSETLGHKPNDSTQILSNAGADASEITKAKGSNIQKGKTKSGNDDVPPAEVQVQVQVQGGDDDWGDDDWE